MVIEYGIRNIDTIFFDFDRNMMEMMPILSIYSSTFGLMGIDGLAFSVFSKAWNVVP